MSIEQMNGPHVVVSHETFEVLALFPSFSAANNFRPWEVVEGDITIRPANEDDIAAFGRRLVDA